MTRAASIVLILVSLIPLGCADIALAQITNPTVTGTIHYAPELLTVTHDTATNWPWLGTYGLVKRSLNPLFDAHRQTNWCLILRSAIQVNADWASAVNPTGWPTAMPTEFVFGTDATSFIVFLRGNFSQMGVEVDGVDDYSRIVTPGDGNYHFYTVAFGSSKRRQIALKLDNYQFGGLYISPTNGLWPGILPKQHRMIVLGDSFSEDFNSTSWPSDLMSLFRNLDVWASAVGATGYINPGPPGRVSFQARILSDVVTNNPEFVLFAGGINDVPSMTNRTATLALQNACLSCYQTIQSNLPNCKVIVLGPFWPGTPANPATVLANNAISNACVIAGIGGNYIDTLSDPWITGTWNKPRSGNAVSYTSGDGVHPTGPGHWNIACHVAAELARRFPELDPR